MLMVVLVFMSVVFGVNVILGVLIFGVVLEQLLVVVDGWEMLKLGMSVLVILLFLILLFLFVFVYL